MYFKVTFNFYIALFKGAPKHKVYFNYTQLVLFSLLSASTYNILCAHSVQLNTLLFHKAWEI